MNRHTDRSPVLGGKPIPTIRDLYPQLSEVELVEAEENLKRYLELVLRIFERLESEGEFDRS